MMYRCFGGRCHWGKYNPLGRAANEALYPGLDRFRDVVKGFDKEGVFKNDWFRELI